MARRDGSHVALTTGRHAAATEPDGPATAGEGRAPATPPTSPVAAPFLPRRSVDPEGAPNELGRVRMGAFRTARDGQSPRAHRRFQCGVCCSSLKTPTMSRPPGSTTSSSRRRRRSVVAAAVRSPRSSARSRSDAADASRARCRRKSAPAIAGGARRRGPPARARSRGRTARPPFPPRRPSAARTPSGDRWRNPRRGRCHPRPRRREATAGLFPPHGVTRVAGLCPRIVPGEVRRHDQVGHGVMPAVFADLAALEGSVDCRDLAPASLLQAFELLGRGASSSW